MAAGSPLKLLFVATKPPWPARDGGRVVVANTLRALSARGAEITLIAPADPNEDPDQVVRGITGLGARASLVPVRRRALVWDWIVACREGAALSIVRHRHDEVASRVAEIVAAESVDVVHAEQLQALANCASARRAGIPVALRAQNVESDLWAQLAQHRPLLRPLLRREARLLLRAEARAVRKAAATIALTEPDAARLAVLAGTDARIVHVPAPFPASLEAEAGEALIGNPALVVFGSGDWLPNRDGASWFVRHVWPEIRRSLPDAVLHVFGPLPYGSGGERIVSHGAPRSSAEPFRGSPILVVPLRIASGVRVKILEAWARGVPVVATPAAVEGLDATAASALDVARDPGEFLTAIRALSETMMHRGKVAAGRVLLDREHSPEKVAARLEALYLAAAHHRPQARDPEH